MFDDLKNDLQGGEVKNQNTNQPIIGTGAIPMNENTVKSQVADMFSDTPPTDQQPVLEKPVINVSPNQAATSFYAVEPPVDNVAKKKIVVLASIVFGVIILIAAVYFGLQSLAKKEAGTIVPVNTSGGGATETPVVAEQRLAATTTSVDQADRDGDGLTDEDEVVFGTSPIDNDTDNDGLFDREEAKVYHSNPLVSDGDGDGVSDGEEVAAGMNPNGAGRLYNVDGAATTDQSAENGAAAEVSVDTDKDGLLDAEEIEKYKTNPKSADSDKDGLDDYQEVKTYKTNPLKKDTDGDKYIDSEEVENGYNPLGPGKMPLKK